MVDGKLLAICQYIVKGIGTIGFKVQNTKVLGRRRLGEI